MAEALTILAAQAAAAAAKPVMGLSYPPTVINEGAYVTIQLDATQQTEVADFLIRQLESAPGAIRVSGLGGVFLRVLVRKYGIWAGASLASAFGLGWLTKGVKR